MRPAALLDSNVLIAAVDAEHVHHPPSLALINDHPDETFAVAAHSFAETYSVLTNPAPRAPFRWPAERARAAIESLAAATRLVGLTHGQTFDALRDFAAGGGVGPRVYDRLIGEAAVRNGIGRILTWNARDMRALFPALEVQDPSACRRGVRP